MDQFEKMVNEFIGNGEKLERRLERLKKEQQDVEKLLAEQKRLEETAKREREVVVRYIPSEVGSVKVVKGAEFLEPQKPDNVVALLDAAALLMAEANGLNRYLILESMLEALVESTEAQMIVKEFMKK